MVEKDIQQNCTTTNPGTEEDGLLPDVDPTLLKAFCKNENLRNRWIRIQFSQFAEMANRNHLVILNQLTFEQLLDILEDGSEPERLEAARILLEMVYTGKSFEGTIPKVSSETLLSHFKESIAEIGLDLEQEEFETIDLRTIRNTFTLFHLAQEADIHLGEYSIKIL